MCSIVPFYLPPPPPGYQLVYVPPTSTQHNHDNRSSLRNSPRSCITSPSAGPSTPPTHTTPLLPTRSDTPMSHRSDGVKHLATDHHCVLRKYEMKMRQQPVQARMCGVGEKSDRRPVDPTPIIQLKVIDENGEDITSTDPRSRTPLRRPSPGPNGMTFMQNPYYFLFACLVGGDENEDELHVIDDGKTRFLTGTPVSSLYHLKDLDNSDAAFFVFPDLGVRKEGRYKLKLTLFEIVDQEVYYCTTTFTSTFSVYSAKKFPGMSKATDLSKSFAEQGLKIRVRKDPRQPAARITKSKRKSDAADSEDDYGSPNHHHSYAHHHSDQHKRQHPPPQHQQQHHHQAKRSRGASLGYPPNEAESAARFYRPTSSHGEASSKPTTYHPSYPPQSSSSNGYPPGYHPNYPPPGRGHHMPPPPPPSAFDPYRNHQALSPSYPPGYPTQYYGSNSGRPSTHPSPGPAPGSASRHHQSLPPPGYGPPEHPNFQHAQQQSPYYAHGQQPPSAGGYHQHQRTPSYPGSPYGEPSGQRGAPWPQSQMQDRERRDTYPQEPEREIAYAREREREREIERERERERERYMSSRGQPQRQRMRDGPRPLSPRSRVSPTRPTSISYQPSPTSSAGSTFGNNNNARPLSSSSRDRLEIVSPNNVTLPPLSLSTPTARNRPMGSGSAPNSAGLPPILSSAERDRERDEVLSQRSASTGIISSSRNQSPLLGSGTPSSAKTTDRMKLHNIVD